MGYEYVEEPVVGAKIKVIGVGGGGGNALNCIAQAGIVNYPNIKAFSVQFHPEACSGPRDTAFLFDRFIKLMEGN